MVLQLLSGFCYRNESGMYCLGAIFYQFVTACLTSNDKVPEAGTFHFMQSDDYPLYGRDCLDCDMGMSGNGREIMQ